MQEEFTYELQNNESDVDSIIDIINEYGICVINNYEYPSELKEETTKAFSDMGTNYEFGNNLRMDKSQYKRYNTIDTYFNNTFFKSIMDKYTTDYDVFNKNIFATKDYKSNEGLGRNGYLHYDRLRCFKFFTYLTDVTENDGPFSIVPKSHIKGHELRVQSIKEAANYGEQKNRIRLDFPELYNESEIVPIIGKAGCLMIFDTDIFHKGGETKNNGERMIIRSHTYLK